MDSGATWSCHPHQQDLINRRLTNETMTGIDGVPCGVSFIGDLPIYAKDHHGKIRRVVIRDVRCVPAFTHTLISTD